MAKKTTTSTPSDPNVCTRDMALSYGAAPNDFENTTLTAARAMAQFWVNLKIENVVGIFVNFTVPPGPCLAPVININDIVPPLEPEDTLYYQVQILPLGQPVPEEPFMNQYAVCQWQPIVNSIGLQAATIQYMDQIDPGWRLDSAKCQVVYALPTSTGGIPLPTPPAPPEVEPEPTGLASPNWLKWVGGGCLAVRAGDYSPADSTTFYEDAKHGKWVKIADKTDPTPFAPNGSLINVRWSPVI